jgi:mono/diheme cytochrome c family protein
MLFVRSTLVFVLCCCGPGRVLAAITPEQAAQLPPPATHAVNFVTEIKPIFESSCIKCHGRGKDKGGFRLDSRETTLKGGDSGLAFVPGKSSESLLISLVQGFDPDNTMPKKGSRLTPQQIGLLRAWIDQGAPWDASVTFGRLEPLNLKPHLPAVPPGSRMDNPVDRFLQPYFAAHKVAPPKPVDDRLFARRAYLDILGLLPPPADLKQFLADSHGDKRKRLVEKLLADDRSYAVHWLSFWNDLLRNDYKGTGYIDGGRKQITTWLYSALLTNMAYNQFVSQLINPSAPVEGFTKGIVWRGVVNASQTPNMQAAQGICQVFMGVNLKCASCHDSFVNDFTLADAYGLAGIYADAPLEMVRCDKPTGKKADLKFIYPELGAIESSTNKSLRLQRLAEVITQPQDGRFTRTLVNRLWQRFFGRGLVEPVDDMEQKAWGPDVLDWLAEDFAGHGYDVKFLIGRILTSRAYQACAVDPSQGRPEDFVFRGPLVRRMTAEQFRDALTSLTDVGYSSPLAEIVASNSEKKKFALPAPVQWIWNDAHAADNAKPGHVYFRKTIKLSRVPTDATALVLCDNSFTLFVNGRKVGSGNDFKTPSVFDLRPWLKSGDNTFAVDGVNHLADNKLPTPETVPGDPGSPAGLLFYAYLRGGETGAQVTNDFGSDKSWLCFDAKEDNWQKPGFVAANWQPALSLGEIGTLPWRASKESLRTKLAALHPGKTRAALVAADPLTTALGRPNREQVVTTRTPDATTLQALEMTNGETLADILKRAASYLTAENKASASLMPIMLYEKALSRKPNRGELLLARDLLGSSAARENVEDLLWAVAMLPEFQLIY